MRNKIILLIMIFTFLFVPLSTSANENWEKLAENLYFDKNSVENQHGYITGYFKQTNINQKIGKEKVAYMKIWAGAYCNIKEQDGIRKLEYPIYWSYSTDGKLLEENNIHEYWRETYPEGHLGVMHPEDDENGEIYFNTLCKYYNP